MKFHPRLAICIWLYQLQSICADILQGAYVYVSGSAEKMPQEVAAVFQQKVLQGEGGLPVDAARKYMRQLEASGRYVVEAWS